VKIGEVYLFIIENTLNGRVEELENGLLFHNIYYLQEVAERGGEMALSLQIKENTENYVKFYPFGNSFGNSFGTALLDGEKVRVRHEKSGMLAVPFAVGGFTDGPEFNWSSGWKYAADSFEVNEGYDHCAWQKLDRPISLEKAGLLGHGYFWYRAQFELGAEPEAAYMDYWHNDTDRYLVYLNGNLVFRSRSKSISQREVTKSLKKGRNTLAVLYANEFHNKSHPHEGDIIKYSGIMHPFIFTGKLKNGEAISVEVGAFYVKRGLQGMAEGYASPAYDDSAWNDAPEAEKYVVERGMGQIVWFRRHFQYKHGARFRAPLKLTQKKADERLTFYVNGLPLGRYDTLGPQEDFYIPEPFINMGGDNVISAILECPGFYEEIMSGFRRGYMYSPVIEPYYTSKNVTLKLALR
jgi:hypothetical protein